MAVSPPGHVFAFSLMKKMSCPYSKTRHAPVGVAPQVAVLSHPPPNPMAAQAAVLAAVPKPAPKKRAPKKVCESCQDKKATHGLKPRPGSDLDLSKRWCAACARQQAGEIPAPARTLLRR